MHYMDCPLRRPSAIVARRDGYWRWWDGSLIPCTASPSHRSPLALEFVLESVAFLLFSLSWLLMRG